MRKAPKIIKELLAIVILTIIVLPVVATLIIQTEFAQQFIVNKLSEVASEKLGSRVSIDKFYYKLFNKVDIEGFYVEDPINNNDTLLYVNKLETTFNLQTILGGDIKINKAAINGGVIKLKGDSTEVLNIKYIVEKLKPKTPDPTKKFNLYIDKIELDSFQFVYQKHKVEDVEFGINFTDLKFIDIKAGLNKFDLMGDSMTMHAEHISFREKGDVTLNHLDSDHLTVSKNLISANRGRIELDNSFLEFKDFTMKFKNWVMYDFVNKVPITAAISNSQIEMSTIEHFTKKRRQWRSNLKVIGGINGTISDLDVNILLVSTHKTKITNTTLNIKGLPHINNTVFNANIGDLATNAFDIYHISEEFTGKLMERNSMLERLGSINLSGKYNGTTTKFHSLGDIKTLIGDIAFEVTNKRKTEAVEIDGTLSSDNLHLGALLDKKSIGQISIEAVIDANLQKENSNIALNSTINRFNLLGYNYANTQILGKFINKKFNGEVTIDDKNLKLNFNGEVDFNENIPKYDFDLNIPYSNLNALNLNSRDSISIFSGEVYANGAGTTIDNINGDIILENLKYINHIDTINIEKISITNTNNSTTKYLKVNSKLVDISLTAQQSYKDIIPYLSSTISKYLPALSKKRDYSHEENKEPGYTESEASEKAKNSFYIATVNVKEANNAAGVFMPGLKISKDTKLSFIFNPALNQFSFNFNSDKIERGDYWIKGVSINSRSEADSISIYTKAEEINISSIFLPNFELIGGVKENNIVASTRFSNKHDGSQALLSTKLVLEESDSLPKITAKILPSYININKNKWFITSDNMVFDNGKLDIGRVHINTQEDKQSINITGVASKDSRDSILVAIENFDINGVSIFTKAIGYDINGRITGKAHINRQDGKIVVGTDLAINKIKLNEYELPDLRLKSRYLGNTEMLYTISYSNKDFLTTKFNFGTKKFDGALKVEGVDLTPLTPLLSTIGSNSTGLADIDITIDNLKMPLAINGYVKVHNLETTIDFTNVRYKLKGDAKIKNNKYNLYNGVITDPNGVTSAFSGSLDGNDRYRRVKYKISAKPNGLQCLSTTITENPQFYGDVRADGNLEIIGHGNQVTMKIGATAVGDSRFYMPLSNKSTITEADFITFTKRDSSLSDNKPRDFITIKKKNKKLTDAMFALDMNIKALSDTEVQIVIDPTLGDIIKAKGSGELNIKIIPERNIFNITGGYEIDNGSYLFTLPNFQLLNKYFIIRPGSTINWTGDPLAANLNITAIYKTKTSLAPLLGSLPQYSQRVDVDCNLSLNGKLLKPDITLGIDVPDANPETASLIASTLNSEEAISKQIFWLLFANSFYADASQATTNVTVGMMESAGTVTGIEFLSNQISNWISNDKFDLGFNYRPKNDQFSNELELNISAPLFNNRIILEAEGNYDFQDNSATLTENSNNLSGNFNITYILNKSGNFRAKAFTRPINTFDENHGLQESGVGIYYKDNFDKFSELLTKYKKNSALRKHYKHQRDSLRASKKLQVESKK